LLAIVSFTLMLNQIKISIEERLKIFKLVLYIDIHLAAFVGADGANKTNHTLNLVIGWAQYG
jgi:uncharacterized membrane protein